MKPYAIIDGWEYYLHDGKIFRVRADNRGYELPEGIPSKARYECTQSHFDALNANLFGYPA